jgi:hypothetical protein
VDLILADALIHVYWLDASYMLHPAGIEGNVFLVRQTTTGERSPHRDKAKTMTEVSTPSAADSIYATIANDILAEAKNDSQKLHDMVKQVKTAKGSADDVKKWIDESTEDTVVKRRDAIANAKAKIAEIQAELEAEARAAIVPDDIDVNAIQESFKTVRGEVIKTLSAARIILGKAGVKDLSEIDELQNNLPKSITGVFSGSGKSPEELAKVREWARANGHTVADQGRIAKSIQDEYDAAMKEGATAE